MNTLDALFQKIGGGHPAGKKPEYLIAGLGNPGKEYVDTRHNMGYMAMDRVAEKCGVRIDRSRFKGLTAEAVIGEVPVLLLKPETFMNLSGEAVAAAAAYYKIPPEKVIILCDDIHFQPGQMRIRLHGSAGGHNGLKSVISCLDSEGFLRIKLGVGQKPHPEYDLADWVLGHFSEAEKETLDTVFNNVYDALSLILSGQADKAMTKYSK